LKFYQSDPNYLKTPLKEKNLLNMKYEVIKGKHFFVYFIKNFSNFLVFIFANVVQQ